MNNWPDELRLAWVVVLTALVFASSLRFSRRVVGGDWVDTLLDALLITFVIQYLAVCVPGVSATLNVWSISVTAVLACALLNIYAREKVSVGRVPGEAPARPREWLTVGVLLFLLAYLGGAVWQQRTMPPMANDPLTYHLPAAVQWLQQGKLSLYETWFYNPANTYSPLAGSVYVVWWLAPLGNDALARFAQAPALLLVLVAMIQLVRALGVATSVAALIALGAITSRPLISQAILAKDDLYVAAFFTASVAALTRVKLTDHLGPVRLAMTLGMLLSVKYTALLSLPILLLAADAPGRVGWKARQWLVVAAGALLLAGPWYVRNAVLTGNPLFPMDLPFLDGSLATRRSPELATAAGLWRTFVSGYASLTITAAAVLVCSWLWAVVVSVHRVWHHPLPRICLLGPPLGLLLFAIFSPYAEVRFVYPSILLMFATAGIVAQSTKQPAAALLVGAVVAVAGLGTGFVPQTLLILLPPALGITLIALLLLVVAARLPARHARSMLATAVLLSVAAVSAYTYIHHSAFLRAPQAYAQAAVHGWRPVYGPIADAWRFVREQTPPDSTLAFTNTFFTYPLYGFDLTRNVVYAPTRPAVQHLHDLPSLAAESISGEQIVQHAAAMLIAEPDRVVWLQNLADREADYLLIVKPSYGPAAHVPELEFAIADPNRFERIFDNDAAAVYRIRPAHQPSGGSSSPSTSGS